LPDYHWTKVADKKEKRDKFVACSWLAAPLCISHVEVRTKMPHTWTQSLFDYRYPVDLSRYADANLYPAWFKFNSLAGDREHTMQFEAHFRDYAVKAIEPWLEVVYWKMYSQPSTRGNKTTRKLAAHFRDNSVKPQTLWDSCNRYIERPTRQHFESVRTALGLASQSIAVAATFPAFLRPDLFPMIDTRIAKWVSACMASHNAADPSGIQLTKPHFNASKQTVLTMNDFSFLQNWILWCRHAALKLTERTSSEWRARDVEMAVFNAWGGRFDNHPKHDLKPLAA
jgi:hypothetical protein